MHQFFVTPEQVQGNHIIITGSDITAKVNEIMAKFMEDGTLDALAEKYNLTLVK